MPHFIKQWPWYAAILSMSMLLLYGPAFYCDPKSQMYDKLMDNSIEINGMLAGFFLTILTIFNSLDTPAMRIVKAVDAIYNQMMKYLSRSLASQFITLTFVLLSPIILDKVNIYIIAAWRLIAVFMILLTWAFSLQFAYCFIVLTRNGREAKH